MIVGFWLTLSDLLMLRAFYEQDQLKSTKRVGTSGVEMGMVRVGSMVFHSHLTQSPKLLSSLYDQHMQNLLLH